jgi:CubicO group peptidase (beta-lactamase class C family)
MRAEVAKGRLPGAVVAIARKGRLVYNESFGYLDKATSAPMPKDAIFAIASMTKPMTAVGIMQLIEEGRIALSDPISKWFPALGKLSVAVLKTESGGQTIVETEPAKRQITIHDLLRHTSGFTYAAVGSTPVHKLYPANALALGVTFTGTELIEKLSSLPLLYQPGSTWEYGLSIDVLGLIVEAETGKSLGAFLQERVWQPLNMVDVSFLIPPDKASRYAKALTNDPITGKPQPFPDRTRPSKMQCGGGCAASTAGDYLRFVQMLLNHGTLDGKRILSRKSVEYMLSNQLGPEIKGVVSADDPTRANHGFGLSVAVRTTSGIVRVLGSVGTFSWPGSTGTDWWGDPKEELAVVFMAAAPGPMRLYYRQLINSLVYQAIAD